MLQRISRAITHLAQHRGTDTALLILISLVAAINWVSPGLPTGHDALLYISRASDLQDALRDNLSFPRWIEQDLGFPPYVDTYLVKGLCFVFSVPFGWVLGAKILYFLIFSMAGVFAYFYVFELTKNRPASFVAGLAYLVTPYHIIEVVFEGHWCYGAAFMLAPVALLSIEKAIQKPGFIRITMAGLVLTLLILTHPQVFPVILGPFLALYALFRVLASGARRLMATAGTSFFIFAIGLLLTAFWWFPLFSEFKYLRGAHTLYSAVTSLSSATFLQAVTLRPDSCCAHSSSFGTTSNAFVQAMQLSLVVMAALGVVLNYRNRHVWFFAVAALLAILLAMGPSSPVNLYGFAHDNVPLFSTMIRTPGRFLLFASMAYAVLAGFAVQGILRHIGRRNLRFCVVVLLSFLLLANTWHDFRSAFDTFELTDDQQSAVEWLSRQEQGRLLVVPQEIYLYSDDTGNVLNPSYCSWLHKKERVLRGDTISTASFLGHLSEITGPQWNRTSLAGISDTMGVRYALIDKTDPASEHYALDETFVKVWTSETIDIYQNTDNWPRVFITNTLYDQYYSQGWTWAEGSQYPAQVTLSYDHTIGASYGWKSDYTFDKNGQNSLAIATDFQVPSVATSVCFWYYVPKDLPTATMEISLSESDGTRYACELKHQMSAGWHNAEVPLSTFSLHPSTDDENVQLDKDQVSNLWITVAEEKQDDTPHSFSIYFSRVSTAIDRLEDIRWEWSQGTQYPAKVTPSYDHAIGTSYAWRSDYIFDKNGSNSLAIATDFQLPDAATSVFFWYYLTQPLPAVTLEISLCESDGTRYACELNQAISEGWHNAEVPLSTFSLHPSTGDENVQLDKGQVSKLWITVAEEKQDDTPHSFSIYFNRISTAVDCLESTSWEWSQGTQYPAQITLSHDYAIGSSYAWKSDYSFDKNGFNWLSIATDFQIPAAANSVSFRYYLPQALPSATMELALWESDGSRYSYELRQEMSAGWHNEEVPLSAFSLHWSTDDENHHLDKDEVSKLGTTVAEEKQDDSTHRFSIYVSKISTVLDSPPQADWQRAEGTQSVASLTQGADYTRRPSYAWKSDYAFDNDGLNWLTLGTDFQMPTGTSSVSLWYCLPEALTAATMELSLCESDGTLYAYDLGQEMSAGWHNAEVPLSAFSLHWSTDDENLQLDRDQVSELRVTVAEELRDNTPHLFSIYFSKISAVIDVEPQVTWERAEGTQDFVQLAQSTDYAVGNDHSWKTEYIFDNEGLDWLAVKTRVKMPADVTHVEFSYYLPQTEPDTYISLLVWEADGSRYESTPIRDMSRGWHTAQIPLSFLRLKYSEDENAQLDNGQVAELGIAVGETVDDTYVRRLTVYLGRVSISAQTMTEVDFTKVSNTKYLISLDVEEPCLLVLTESYYPGWTGIINDESIASEKTCEFANGWQISDPGQYQVVLKFRESPQRKAATFTSLVILVALTISLIVHKIKPGLSKALGKMRAAPGSVNHQRDSSARGGQ